MVFKPEPYYKWIVIPILLLFTHVSFSQGLQLRNRAVVQFYGNINVKITGQDGGLSIDDASELRGRDESILSVTKDIDAGSGTFATEGTLVFAGSQAQSFIGNSQALIKHVSVENSNGVNLQMPLLLTGSLNLLNGNLITSSQNILIVSAGATINASSETGYVNGPLAIRTRAQEGESYDLFFPIGRAEKYRPVRLKFTQTNDLPTDYLVETFLNFIPNYSLNDDIEAIASTGYWSVDNGNTNNFSQSQIILPIFESDGINADDAIIAKSTGDNWENIGGQEVSVPGTVSSNVSFTSLGDFILASEGEPIVLIPTLDDANIAVFEGEELILSGTNLGTDVSELELLINEKQVPVTEASTNLIKFIVPSDLNEGISYEVQLTVKGQVASGNVTITLLSEEEPIVNRILDTNIRAGDVITLEGRALGSDINALTVELVKGGTTLNDAASISGLNSLGSELQLTLASGLLAGSYQINVYKDEVLIGTLELQIVPTPTDTEAPEIIHTTVNNHSPLEALILSVTATDESGIDLENSSFRFAGLSENFSEASTLALINSEGEYSVEISSPLLDGLDDPIGIQYEFIINDMNGNQDAVKGYTYWFYDNSTFGASDALVGPWKDIGNKENDFQLTDYNIIALPFDPQSINQVPGLGSPDDKQWRLFRHQAGAGSEGFQEYGKEFSQSSRFIPGQGYFLIMRDNNVVKFGGQIAEMTEIDGYLAHEIELQNGWNLIGNPFPVEIDWSIIRNHPLNDDIRDQLDDNLEILSNSNSGDYVQTVQLEGFHGAFVNYSGTQSGSLYISPSILHSTNNSRIQRAKNKGWQLPLMIDQGNFSSSRGGVGMHPEARESRDWYDVLQVPKIAGQAEFVVYHQGYPMNRSIVPEQPSYHWQAELTSMRAGETIRLSWNTSEIPESAPGLFIWDELNSRLIDMKQNDQSHFQLPESGKLPLQIYYGIAEDVFSVLDIRNINAGKPYPNPVINMFMLPVSIPVGQQLQANTLLILYDNHGQQIAQYNFENLMPGYHELEISLPEGLADGLYHYQLSIAGSESKIMTGRIIKQ